MINLCPKYPDVHVRLTGSDGNGFAIIGKVRRAMQQARVPNDQIDAFIREAKSGDYDNLLETCWRWVNVS
jgi:hypothetical protein